MDDQWALVNHRNRADYLIPIDEFTEEIRELLGQGLNMAADHSPKREEQEGRRQRPGTRTRCFFGNARRELEQEQDRSKKQTINPRNFSSAARTKK